MLFGAVWLLISGIVFMSILWWADKIRLRFAASDLPEAQSAAKRIVRVSRIAIVLQLLVLAAVIIMTVDNTLLMVGSLWFVMIALMAIGGVTSLIRWVAEVSNIRQDFVMNYALFRR